MASSGLEGVVVAQTRLSRIDGRAGKLIYAGYTIEDLAEQATFEEVCHLLWHGELPTRSELDALRSRLADAYPLDDEVLALVRRGAERTHPMAVLRTAVSAQAFADPDADDASRDATLRKAVRLTAQMASVTAAIQRIRSGAEPVAPKPALGHGANLLYMMTGEEPDEAAGRVMDVALILHAEHGLNASTFSSRVTIATLSDLYSAITSAIGTLKGPLHGGANERVRAMLDEIGSPDRAEAWIGEALDRKEKIMGFGHRVYRTLDPRAPILRGLADDLTDGESARWLEISDRVAEVMRQAMEARGKQIYPNVDFYSASVYSALGIPTDLFTNIFACARIAGWTAHDLEQLADNRLIRPKAEYVGAEERAFIPIEQRT